MSDYDYINARVKGMCSQLLSRQFYDQVLAVSTQDVLVDSLLNSSYGPALRESLALGQGLPAVEAGLRRNLFQVFAAIRTLAPPEPRRLIEIHLRRWDITNIMTILRGKAGGTQTEDIMSSLFPAGALDEAMLAELAEEPDMVAVADALTAWGLPLAFELRRIIKEYAEPPDLVGLEAAFAREYFSWALAEVPGQDENHILIRTQIQLQIDLMNVMTALRTIQQELMNRQCEPIVPIAGGQIGRSVLKKLEMCKDIDSALEILASTHLAPGVEKGILAFGEHRRLGVMERFLECVVIERGCRMFRADPLGIGVTAGYIWRKFNEFVNLRVVLRGKAYGRPAAAIREELLIV